MTMPGPDDVAVVLVEPRHPGNVGSVARVMANMGFVHLSLVKPCPLDHPETRQMALGALTIVERAAVFESLAEALEGIRYAVATTCRGGKLRDEAMTPRSLASRMEGLAPGRVALVFGPEDRGLDNAELTLCHAVATIPSHPGFPSLNISHAVMIFLWELRSAGGSASTGRPERRLADAAALEGMYMHLEEVLLEVGFLHPENPQRMIRVLRKALNRAALDEREVRAIRGILRQFDWYLRRR